MPVDPKKVTQLDGNTFLPAGTEPRDNMFSKEKTKPEERGNATDVRTSKKEVVDELEDTEEEEEVEEAELSEDDEDFDEDDEDDEEEEVKPRKRRDKKVENAEKQRREMQSERDKAIAQLNSQSLLLNQALERIEKLEQKQNSENSNRYSDSDDFERDFDENDIPNMGQVAKIVDSRLKKTHVIKPDTDIDNLDMEWVKSHEDAHVAAEYMNQNVIKDDPEIAGTRTIKGMYMATLAKARKKEVLNLQKEVAKLKKQLKKMKRGSLPETGPGRGRASSIQRVGPKKSYGDPLADRLAGLS